MRREHHGRRVTYFVVYNEFYNDITRFKRKLFFVVEFKSLCKRVKGTKREQILICILVKV